MNLISLKFVIKLLLDNDSLMDSNIFLNMLNWNARTLDDEEEELFNFLT